MPMLSEDLMIAREVKTRLEKRIQVLDCRLFGSRARGDADPESDMDLFLEVAKGGRETEDLVSDIAWEVGLKYQRVISPLVFSRYEVEETPLRISPILLSIRREGVRI